MMDVTPQPRGRAFPLIDGQQGLATTAQLRDHGWSRAAIGHALGTTWQYVYPGVVAGHRGPLDVDTRLAGVALWAGESAVLTAGIALQRQGLVLPRVTPVARFLVPPTSRSRTTCAVLTLRTSRAIAVARRTGCISMTGVARALADAARYDDLPPSDLTSLTISALQRRFVSPQLIDEELRSSRHNGLAPVRAGLTEFTRGAWSVPEATLGKAVSKHADLPDMLLNARLHAPDGTLIGVPDGYFREVAVAVQVHSRTHHSGYDEDGVDRWTRTVEHDQRLESHGIVVIGVTPATLARRLDRFLAHLARTISSHQGRVLPEVIIG